jgi:hypothetical protein
MEVDESVNNNTTKGDKQDVAITVPMTGSADSEPNRNEEQQETPMQADEDDAVEY